MKQIFKRLLPIIMVTMLIHGRGIIHAQKMPAIIPAPVQLKLGSGYFEINQQTAIRFKAGDARLQKAANYLAQQISLVSGLKIPINTVKLKNISLSLGSFPEIGQEGYLFESTEKAISIRANTTSGIIYGIQSLLQTLPAIRTNAALQVPAMQITDYPRFKWRGMHLDVSRHFFGPEFIKNYIDLMAAYKLNTFHWHLVDDQGWRIEIKKYPKLTETGAWRVDQNDKIWSDRPQAKPGEAATYGGYYTQQQLREIVTYAAERNITIVPEIEMPGHVASAISAYPELSCTQIPQLPLTGGNYSNMASGYCAGNEQVFQFLENVLDETMAIFPSRYIHIGGDELDKGPWKVCSKCQARIKTEGLKDVDELQSYFIKRIEKFLTSRNRQLIGWDEILEGGLAPEATVMSWRGEAGGIEAAKMKHDVVMTPGNPLYFDHYQAGPAGEPLAIGGFNTLKKVYDYNPIPSVLPAENAKYILGAQANLWTEYVTTAEQVEYMVLPRMIALAEAVWSPLENKNWTGFYERLQPHFRAFEQKGQHYSPGNFTASIIPQTKDGMLYASLQSEIPGTSIHYTLDGKNPDASSTIYNQPVRIDSSLILNAVVFRNGKLMSPKPASQSFSMHKAIGRNVKYEHPISRYYQADGPNSLTDGVRGTLAVGKYWHGIVGKNLVATVDLGKATPVNQLTLGCLQNYPDWVFIPDSVKFEGSEDGVQFRLLGGASSTISKNQIEAVKHDFKVEIPTQNIRYIRVTANNGLCPAGHPGAGKPAWIFADELIVH